MASVLFCLVVLCLPYQSCVAAQQCSDFPMCAYLASQGECEMDPEYMLQDCPRSCKNPCICGPSVSNDTACDCLIKAKEGYCNTSGAMVDCATTCADVQHMSCPPLDPPNDPNAHLSTISTQYLTTVIEICNEGYQPVSTIDHGKTMCVRSGKWQKDWVYGNPIICELIDCGNPPTTDYTFNYAATTTVGSTAEYTCHSGYVADQGQTTLICNAAGYWEGEPLACRKLKASRVIFKAYPEVVQPVLTKSLELRCAVDRGALNLRANKPYPPLVGKRQYTSTTWPPYWGTTTPVLDIDTDHIISIIISRQNPSTGQFKTVASVSSYDPATISSSEVGNPRVTGDTESSPVSTEQGYLSVIWDNSVLEQAGNYTCEVSALDYTMHPFTVTGNLAVTKSEEPNVEELVAYVMDNERYISQLQNLTQQLQDSLTQLQNQVDNLQQSSQSELQDLRDKTANMSAQNIQTGKISCEDSYQDVSFPVPYESTPSVFFSVNRFTESSGSWASSYNIELGSVNKTGFTAQCSDENSLITVDWLAVGV